MHWERKRWELKYKLHLWLGSNLWSGWLCQAFQEGKDVLLEYATVLACWFDLAEIDVVLSGYPPYCWSCQH